MLKESLIVLIRLYKKFISPCLGPHCRFKPSCSEYSVLVIKKYGALKGAALTCWRVLRCNPWSKGGVDVP